MQLNVIHLLVVNIIEAAVEIRRVICVLWMIKVIAKRLYVRIGKLTKAA